MNVDLEILAQQLTAGLARVAVAMREVPVGGEPPAGVERTLAESQVMLVLTERPQEYPVARLADDLAMPAAAVLAAVTTLAREGLVELTPSPSYSPLETQVMVTSKGLVEPLDYLRWAGDTLALLDRLDEPTQRDLLARVTERIAVMQKLGQIPVTRLCVTCRYFDAYAHLGTEAPHHCTLVDAAFGTRDLRLRCPEQETVEQATPGRLPSPTPSGSTG
jgi:DNA-binding IclR family transcriptional regulator